MPLLPTASRSRTLSNPTISQEFSLPADNSRLLLVCGQFDAHLRQIEQRLKVQIAACGNQFTISGFASSVAVAGALMQSLFELSATCQLTAREVHLSLQEANTEQLLHNDAPSLQTVRIKTKMLTIIGRGYNQQNYLDQIMNQAINFGVGPAGTGKTYLAVAGAVASLQAQKVRRIVLVRPAVEAGEKLGFLPGDMAQKINPYLRPLYDALYEMLGFEEVEKLIGRDIIEIAPLAFMRGRTLNDSFVILDEAQNTTPKQIKMFLTRIGFGSTAVITGDTTQIDLPNKQLSGLKHALQVLQDLEGVSVTFFNAKDVVRHPLVQRIVVAYEQYEQQAP